MKRLWSDETPSSHRANWTLISALALDGAVWLGILNLLHPIVCRSPSF